MRGGARHPRIDHDEVCPIELLALEQVLQRHRMGLRRIGAHDDQRLGVADIVVAVGHRAVAPGVGDTRDGGGMTESRLVVGVVRSPEGGELAEEIRGLVRELGRAEPIDGFRSGGLTDRHQLVADLADGLIPGNAHPLSVHELRRIFESPFATHELAHRCTFRAMRSAIDRAVPARLLAKPDTILHLRRDRAAYRAMRADALARRGRDPRLRRRAGFRIADAADRQRAERGKSAGCKTGAAKERAAVHPARLRPERADQGAAAGGAFRSLDEHQRLPRVG